MTKFHYTLAKHENGDVMVSQQKIGNIVLSFNPDDDKFYVTDEEHHVYCTGKSWRNVVARANKLHV
jgi:hypothetical protein